jgi:trimeric autotransporter adhesin
MLCCVVSLAVKAQVNYSFAASSGTYTPISGTAATMTATSYDGGAAGLDEGYANGVPIGFSFSFNGGTPVTTVGIVSNGFLYFGSTSFTASSTFYTNDLTAGFSAQRPFIAPLWDDLLAGAIEYTTSGSAPNRVFTVQWSNVKWRYDAPAAAVSFQVKLYETTNVIEFIYSNLGGAVVSGGASIGLAATGTGSGNFMSLSSSGVAPTASTTSETTTIATVPATGQKYTFTPTVALTNDAQVVTINTLGKIPLAYGAGHTVKATVSNLGTSTQTNLMVTLNITGANTFTNTQTILSLASGASTTVTFAGFTPTNLGTNTVTVSVPSDQDNTNNSKVYTQDVTYRTYSYADNSPQNSALGYNTGAGLIVNKHTITGSGYVRTVSVFIASGGNAVGNSVYGVVLDAAGTIIGQSAPYTVQAADEGKYKLFTILAPPAITNQDFYVGLAQTANAVSGYYPVGTQTESPARAGAFYTAPLVGGAAPTQQTTFGRFMIAAGVESTLPVEITQFRGERKAPQNILYWTTVTESNNKGFSIERSIDGKNFSAIGFVATKAENGNSASVLNYSFADATPFAGTNYYRLKQTDLDGKITYSSIVELKGEKGGFFVSAAYPNPVRQNVTVIVSVPAAEKAFISLTDMNGQLVKQLNTSLASGDNTISMNVAELASGLYYIRVVSNNETKVVQFVKH